MAPTPGNSFYDHEFEIRHTDFDPERAGTLLDGLNITDKDGDGWRDRPDGSALSLEVLVGDYETPKIPVMEIITNDWQAIGLNFTISSQPSASRSTSLRAAARFRYGGATLGAARAQRPSHGPRPCSPRASPTRWRGPTLTAMATWTW